MWFTCLWLNEAPQRLEDGIVVGGWGVVLFPLRLLAFNAASD